MGKTTQQDKLRMYLEAAGKTVLTVRDPGSTLFAEVARPFARQVGYELNPLAQFLLFCATRIDLVEKVLKPALESDEYDFALLDRWWMSTYIYQCLVGGNPEDMFWLIHDSVGFDGDLTFVIDGEPEQCLYRAKGDSSFEKIELQTQFKGHYLESAEKFPGKHSIVTTRSIDKTFEEIRLVVENTWDLES